MLMFLKNLIIYTVGTLYVRKLYLTRLNTINGLIFPAFVHYLHPFSENLGRKDLVRVYNPHKLLACLCGGQMCVYNFKIWQVKWMQWKTCSISGNYVKRSCLFLLSFNNYQFIVIVITIKHDDQKNKIYW
jgi:hypothetical protein